MVENIPSVDDIRAALSPLSMRQLGVLAELSGVPETTIYKIKLGTTENPGIETIRQFLPHVGAAAAWKADKPGHLDPAKVAA